MPNGMGAKLRPLTLFGMCFLVLSGCASYQLQMSPSRDAIDESVITPKLGAKKYARLMVIPPSGTVRGQFDHQIALFEREFLKSGTTIISGAITGRVVAEMDTTSGKERRSEGVAQLSDAERALVMAKDTGADAILQIGRWEYTADAPSRYFILDAEKDDQFREVQLAEYRSWMKEKVFFPSKVLHFVGRLTDVSTGEVVASFKLKDAVNWNLPSEYRAKIKYKGCPSPQVVHEMVQLHGERYKGWVGITDLEQANYDMESKKCPIFEDENFRYLDPSWLPEAEEKLQALVIQIVAKAIASQQRQ